jgi:hypothetical protein
VTSVIVPTGSWVTPVPIQWPRRYSGGLGPGDEGLRRDESIGLGVG